MSRSTILTRSLIAAVCGTCLAVTALAQTKATPTKPAAGVKPTDATATKPARLDAVKHLQPAGTLTRGLVFITTDPTLIVVVDDSSNDVKVIDSKTKTEVKTFKGHTAKVRAVAISDDGLFVATASDDKSARVFDYKTGLQKSIKTHEGPVPAVFIGSDGSKVFSASGGTVTLWDSGTPQGTEIHTYVHGATVTAIGASKDAKTLMTGGSDHIVCFWDGDTGTKTKSLSGHTMDITSVAVDPLGNIAISASLDTTAITYDVKTKTPIITYKGLGEPVKAVAISGNALKALVMGEHYGKGIDPKTAKELWELYPTRMKNYAASLSKDGTKAATGGEKDPAAADPGTVALYDTPIGQ